MSALPVVLLGVVLAGTGPLSVDVSSDRDALGVTVRLTRPLPSAMDTALPSGAMVRIRYPLRVRSDRRLWWDRRLFRGDIIVSAAFDPLTGRYRCELSLDEVMVDTAEYESADDARRWLRAPPTVRLVLPEGRRLEGLTVRVRAVFSASTRWLVFPDIDGTPWVELPVELAAAPGAGTDHD